LFQQGFRGGKEGSALKLKRGRRIEWRSYKSLQGREVNMDRFEG
jgi:hypothetical protein